jgi:hypothetical protein
MITGAVFFALGYVCGLFLRFPLFVTVLLLSIPVYATLQGLSGAGAQRLAYDVVISTVALQVGYFAAVVHQILCRRLRARYCPWDRTSPRNHGSGQDVPRARERQ